MIRLMAIGIWAVLCLAAVPAMADSKPFVCVNEKDHLPPLDPQADAWYREAATLAKPDTLRPWPRIVDLYSKAVERGHWKAMHNLASLYRTGWPGGVEKDTQKALDLYQKMIDLKVPQGFYDMAAMIGSRAGVKNPATDGLTFLDKAASLGNPPALTELGRLYIYVAGQDELGLKYTNCAAGQGYAPANYELRCTIVWWHITTQRRQAITFLLQAKEIMMLPSSCPEFLIRLVPMLTECGTPPMRGYTNYMMVFTTNFPLILICVFPT